MKKTKEKNKRNKKQKKAKTNNMTKEIIINENKHKRKTIEKYMSSNNNMK